MLSQPFISIITVTYNARDALAVTLKSVAAQTFSDYEYLVIDGGSSDGTVELLKNSCPPVSRWISEKDNGLYEAMNKGNWMAKGKYLLFLNAGDYFYSSDVLEKIAGLPGEADVYYGQTMIVDSTEKELGLRRLKAPEHLCWENLLYGMLVCHQSFLVKKEIAPLYDLQYHITSDYDWMIRCLKKSSATVYTGLIISSFTDGGLNKKRMFTGLKERFLIMKKHFGLFKTLCVHLYFPFRFFFYYLRHGRV